MSDNILDDVSPDAEEAAVAAVLSGAQETGPRLTDEERQLKALELQKRIREKRLRLEKEEAIQQEKLRMESTKALLESKRKFEEAEAKRAVEQQQREKEERKRANERQRELLIIDFRERFGREPTEQELAGSTKKKSAKEMCMTHLAELKSLAPASADIEQKQAILKCCKFLRTYLANVKENPTEQKFRRIKKSNKIFSEHIAPYEAAVGLLRDAGFDKEDDEHMSMVRDMPDVFLLAECTKFLDLIMHRLM